MSVFKKNLFRRILACSILAVIFFVAIPNAYSKTFFDEIQQFLTKNAGFNAKDLTDLRKREPIIKLLPNSDKREVAIFGMVAVDPPLETVLQNLLASMQRQNKKSLIESGEISEFPEIKDLQNLTLEGDDIEDIKKCLSGNCGFGLSGEMIERFRKDIDLTDPKFEEKANQLFRQLLLEYLQRYLEKGNSALIEYANSKNGVSLRDEQASLLKSLSWISDFAPEFGEFLEKYPKNKLPNVKQTINWTKLTFGLKPLFIITQTITFKTEKDGISQVLSVSKQLYASRYFDSSLGLTAVISFPDTADSPNSYLVYTNHSRSNTLDGAFNSFKRTIVEGEAIEKLKPLLADARKPRNPPESDPGSGSDESLFVRLTQNTWLIVTLGILLGISAAILVRKSFLRKS